MQFIKNYKDLASSLQRKHALEIINAAFSAIQPQAVLKQQVSLEGNILHIQQQTFKLKEYKRVFVIGFGKGSAGICQFLEKTLGDFLTDGYDIDVVNAKFKKIHFILGTHPLPSQENIDYTNTVLSQMKNVTEKDLVLVVICGGGSAMFESPVRLSLNSLVKLFKDLLRSGATISEMNAIRKHVSKVKGGGLAYHLYPAQVASLIFSDVPGNNLSVIASGPTVVDTNTLKDTQEILKKYALDNDLSDEDFAPTPTDEKYFARVSNMLIVSNMTALSAMRSMAEKLGYKTRLYSDRVQGEAKTMGEMLISQTKKGEILFAGGETTTHVTGKGKGGRNQALVLAALPFIDGSTLIASFDTDGKDFYGFTGAIGDMLTVNKASEKHLDFKEYLDNDDSYTFFEKVGDGIDTGDLESNVSDVMFVMKI